MSEPREPLFNQRVLRMLVEQEIASGVEPSDLARERMAHWIDQLQRGALDRVSESTAEQTFNNEIFGTVLGYTQFGQAVEHTLLPKRTGASGRDTLWHQIEHLELENEALVSRAYRVPGAIYDQLLQSAPIPEVSWALR